MRRALAVLDLHADGAPELVFEDELGARDALLALDGALTPVSPPRVYWNQCAR